MKPKVHLIAIIILASSSYVPAETLAVTPKTDLEFVHSRYRFGTNFLARGMFREADFAFETGIERANSRLRELETLNPTNAPLQDSTSHEQTGEIKELKGLEADFRTLVAHLERGRKEVAVERAKPLDVKRALGIAKENYEEAKRLIERRSSTYMGAGHYLGTADAYLQDIRKAGKMDEESSALAAMLVRARDILDLRAFRYYAEKARYQIRRYEFSKAKWSAELAVSMHLENMEKSGRFPNLVASLQKEAEDLKRAADLSEENHYLATGDREMARRRWSGNARRKPLKEELAGTDLVGMLKKALNESFVRIFIICNWGELDIEIPKDKWGDVFDTLRAAKKTQFPANMKPVQRVHLEFVLVDNQRFDVLTAAQDGEHEVFRDSPEILFLDLVFLHGEPNDAYLDFPGYLGELFTPGGKTIKIPGFRDFLERVYVRESL